MPELRDDEVVLLKGRPHPLYKGVLRLAIENGLTELSVRLLQAPDEANGGMAICEATAVFSGPDGQVRRFVEIGDADGKNTGAMIAPHRIRMSATRAKGRALRDALGIGEALSEEMGGEPHAPPQMEGYQPAYDPDEKPAVKHWPTCKACGEQLSRGEVDACRQAGIDHFCVKHAPGRAKHTHGFPIPGKQCAECGAALTDAQAMISTRKYSKLLCPNHQRVAA